MKTTTLFAFVLCCSTVRAEPITLTKWENFYIYVKPDVSGVIDGSVNTRVRFDLDLEFDIDFDADKAVLTSWDISLPEIPPIVVTEGDLTQTTTFDPLPMFTLTSGPPAEGIDLVSDGYMNFHWKVETTVSGTHTLEDSSGVLDSRPFSQPLVGFTAQKRTFGILPVARMVIVRDRGRIMSVDDLLVPEPGCFALLLLGVPLLRKLV